MGEREEIGLEDAYKAPIATNEFVATPAVVHPQPFYVVSTSKLIVLYVSTFGVYQVYWFYKHWKCFRDYADRSVSPFWRTFFTIFFTHSLFSNFNLKASERGAGQPLSGMATLFVILSILSRILDRVLASSTATSLLDVVGWLVVLANVVPLVVAQRVANAACDDPEGRVNTRFTLVNFIFMGLGGLLWLAVIAGAIMPELPDESGVQYH